MLIQSHNILKGERTMKMESENLVELLKKGLEDKAAEQ